jgi:hypothetical protein
MNLCYDWVGRLPDAHLDIKPHSRIVISMKTTIDLPDALLEQTKIAAVRRRTSIKNLVIEGLEHVLREEIPAPQRADAMARLSLGFHLGGQPLSRAQSHVR